MSQDRLVSQRSNGEVALPSRPDRRAVLRAGLAGLGVFALERTSRAQSASGGASHCSVTEDNIEGPYYLPGAPRRSDLVTAGVVGTSLVIEGLVRSTRCAPLAGAVIEVWQADARGQYDLRGHRLRGALVTDAAGRYRLHTIVPGRYLNGARYRPAHVHVKVRANGHRALTTQLYFPGDPYNAGDPFIRPSLVMQIERDGAGLVAHRDLVLLPG
jgi:protocatechuate 3,4-dioxygenase beta subunit